MPLVTRGVAAALIPLGKLHSLRPLPAHVGLRPQRVADIMSRHNRYRGRATRAKPAPPRPPRDTAPALTVMRPTAAGIDVHSVMHMVCVPVASAPPTTDDGGFPRWPIPSEIALCG